MFSHRNWLMMLVLVPAIAFGMAACDEGTGPEPSFAIKFGVRAPVRTASLNAGVSYSIVGGAQEDLVVAGTNGTLRITDIRLIVDEFELERVEVSDCDLEPKPAGCHDFEIGPFFVAVPLGGQPLPVGEGQTPAGTYKELEFEVNDVEVDSGEDGRRFASLIATVRESFSDWPDKASMVVVGTFTPPGGATRSFRTYFEAEIEVELEFRPPLEISDVSRSVVIQLLPDMWFRSADARVIDLSQFDFQATRKLVEFELEMEKGFELEIE